MIELTCSECQKVTVIDKDLEKELQKKFDSKYPARTVIVECSCGFMQFTIGIRSKKGDTK